MHIVVPLATNTLAVYAVAVLLQMLRALVRWRIIKVGVWILGLIAVSLHSILLHEWIDIAAGQNLNVLNLISLTGWLLAVMLLIVALMKSIDVLFLIIFPVNLLSILLILLFPNYSVINTLASPGILLHILLSIVTFCVLCFAGLLAVLLAIQEWLLRYRPQGKLIHQLPALESSESLLFQVIGLGFILLTVLLITSFYFYHALLFENTILIQKTVLAVIAWFIFIFLLLGRYRWGWRGRQAIYHTLLGVVLLFIIYFGSKLLLETLY